jgi:hypothetical protein
MKLTTHFPRFVIEEDNQMLMEEVSKEQLKIVLASFKIDKSQGLRARWMANKIITGYMI